MKNGYPWSIHVITSKKEPNPNLYKSQFLFISQKVRQTYREIEKTKESSKNTRSQVPYTSFPAKNRAVAESNPHKIKISTKFTTLTETETKFLDNTDRERKRMQFNKLWETVKNADDEMAPVNTPISQSDGNIMITVSVQQWNYKTSYDSLAHSETTAAPRVDDQKRTATKASGSTTRD